MNGEIWDRLERSDVELLPLRNLQISRRRFHQSREVPDAIDRDPGQHLTAEFGDVEPLVRRVLDGTVVQVEAVDVNIRSNPKGSEKKQSRLAAARTLAPKIEGGCSYDST